MSKEQAVQIKPEKKPSKKSLKNRQELDKEGGRICIIHSQNNKSEKDVRPLTENSFIKIKEVASVRQQSSSKNTRLSDIIEKLPEELDSSVHGYHRKCYQTFTNIARLKRKIGNTDIATDEANTSKRRRSSGLSIAGAILFPADKCLFCDKKVLKIKGDKQPLVKCVTKTAETSIRLAAEQKNNENLLCRIRDINLIAKEAHYHNHCRRSYTRSDVRRPINPNSETSAVLSAHKKAFDSLCKYVQENIIEQMKVERMTMLRERYLLYLLEVDSTVHNENYKTDKLKDKLKNFFGGKIQFWRPSSKGELVYSNDVEKGQAVELAFELACSDEKRVEEAAMILRRHITESKKVAAEMPYPPTASWLMSEERQPPTLLRDFLSNLVAGKSKEKLSAKALRFVSSCSQDICFATTNGQWAMPKHILLAMTIHHLTGSAEIISLLNRYGHCQSYTRTLELETAMCHSVTAFNNILPPSISIENNSVVHLCWDNFDLNEETPSGAGTTHTAHGIIIQELENDSILRTRDLPQVPKTNERTVHPVIEDIQPCFAKAKAEPKLNVSRVQLEPCDSMYFNFSDFTWMLCRKESSETEQNIPSWAGWLSATSQPTDQSGKEPRCSIVDYMASVLQPVTENATVQHILEVSKKATENVGQDFTIVTFDLGVAKKAFNIVWQNHIRFGNVIIRIGVFHTICSLFGALGKHMKGSGIEDIAIEAGICASGSLQKVMSGKHYNRALRVHKLVLEALERLLFEAFQTHDQLVEGLSDETENVVRKLVEKPDCEHFQSLVRTQDFKRLFDRYEVFKDSVRNGSLGKTSQFWLGYMDIIWSILSFIRATKENNLELHLAILYELCPLFFTYNHHNYSRYIPAYLIMMLNLSETHPGAEELLRKNGFSVSRSTVPLSRNPVDITIKQTINCHAKSHGGIIGFSRNYSAYYRWCVTRHLRAKYVEATLNMADMTSTETSVHKELRSSQKKSSEQGVTNVKNAIAGFTNPLTVENKEELYCLSSGLPASNDVASSLLKAKERGKSSMVSFIEDRLVDKTIKFHDPIQQTKYKTFASMGKSQKIKSSQNKLIEVRAERNVFAQLVMLSLKNNIDLELTMSYQLGPVPWTLATADGCPVKSDKSKLLHKLEETIEPSDKPSLEDSVYVCDGNAILQALTQIPETFEAVAERVFEMLPKTKRVDFVTDSYYEHSIKSFERSRRGEAPTFLLSGPKTKTPRDWKLFMSNDNNKSQLIKLLLSEWRKPKYATSLKGRELFFVCREECVSLASSNGVLVETRPEEDLFSSQEEADTRMILHCQHIVRNCQISDIIVRSPDTDVLILLTKFSQVINKTILFDTGVGNKRRLFKCK